MTRKAHDGWNHGLEMDPNVDLGCRILTQASIDRSIITIVSTSRNEQWMAYRQSSQLRPFLLI